MVLKEHVVWVVEIRSPAAYHFFAAHAKVR